MAKGPVRIEVSAKWPTVAEMQPWQREVMRRIEEDAERQGGRVVVSCVPRRTALYNRSLHERIRDHGQIELCRMLHMWPEHPQGSVPANQRYRIGVRHE